MLRKHFHPLLALLAIIALGAGVAVQHWSATATAASAAPPPEPALTDLDGKRRTLAEWRGKVVVLNFWASWCSPCRQEMPEFVRLQKELGEQGLQFVGVAIDEPDGVREFLRQTPVNYPVLIGDEHAPEWAERLGNRLSALPFSVIFDRDGKIAKSHMGILTRETLGETVRPLLDRSPSTPKP